MQELPTNNNMQNLWLSKYKNNGKVPADLEKFSRPTKPSAPIIGDDGEYQCDLMFLSGYSRFNGGKGVILNLVNVPTRFLYSELLKTKGESADYLIEIIPTLSPPMTIIRIDNGNEFVNNKLKKFLEDQGITMQIANKNQNEPSSSLGIVKRLTNN